MNEQNTRDVMTVESGLGAISAAEWDACANPPGRPYNPFITHGFLNALEESGSVHANSGWLPRHLVLRGDAGELLGTMPLYVKAHSYGEYVFDHGWADAFERAGGRYYPKLQSSVPFTPVTSPRLLVRETARADDYRRTLLSGAVSLADQLGLSSAHFTFLTEPDRRVAGMLGLLQRTDRQFHWENKGFETFDAFLESLQSRKRKTIRRERRDALSDGLVVEWIGGNDLTEAHWDAFFRFYRETGARKWGRPYLNREFFSLVSKVMAERILLVMCRRGSRYIAGALNFIGSDTLYGRYWGTVEDHPFLHFEICYYQAIEYAIAHGLKRVEAGAQGEHKLARGYLPHITYSTHYLAHPGLKRAVADYLEHERIHVAREAEMLSAHAPFRKEIGKGSS